MPTPVDLSTSFTEKILSIAEVRARFPMLRELNLLLRKERSNKRCCGNQRYTSDAVKSARQYISGLRGQDVTDIKNLLKIPADKELVMYATDPKTNKRIKLAIG